MTDTPSEGGVTSNVVTPRANQGPTERPLDEEPTPGWEPGMADQQETDAIVEEVLAEESQAKAEQPPAEAPATPAQ